MSPGRVPQRQGLWIFLDRERQLHRWGYYQKGCLQAGAGYVHGVLQAQGAQLTPGWLKFILYQERQRKLQRERKAEWEAQQRSRGSGGPSR